MTTEEILKKTEPQLANLEQTYRNDVLKNYFYRGRAILDTKRNQRAQYHNYYGETALVIYQVLKNYEDLLEYLEIAPHYFYSLTIRQMKDLHTFIQREKEKHAAKRAVKK